MRRARALIAIAALLGAACRHPTKVGDAGAAERPAAKEKERRGETSAQKGVPPRGERPRVPASPKALLAEGEIAKLQDALSGRGYLATHRAGELDDPTTQALRKFQREEGLAETGFPDRLTLRKLGIDPEEAYGKVSKEGERERGEGKGGGGEGSAGSGGSREASRDDDGTRRGKK